MAALHAKVISVDKKDNLITSANLSYHGQEGKASDLPGAIQVKKCTLT